MNRQTFAIQRDCFTEIDLGPYGRALVQSTVPFAFGACLFAEGTLHSIGGHPNRLAKFKAYGRTEGELTVSQYRPSNRNPNPESSVHA